MLDTVRLPSGVCEVKGGFVPRKPNRDVEGCEGPADEAPAPCEAEGRRAPVGRGCEDMEGEVDGKVGVAGGEEDACASAALASCPTRRDSPVDHHPRPLHHTQHNTLEHCVGSKIVFTTQLCL